MPADPFAALGNGRRREILDLVRRRPGLNARDVAAAFPEVSEPAVARHLRILRDAGLVRATRRGREAHYSVVTEPLTAMYSEYLRLFIPLAKQSLENLRRIVEDAPE